MSILAIGAAAGSIAAILALIGVILRAFVRVGAPHFARAVRDALSDEMTVLHKELQLNGGTSLKDAVNDTRDAVRALSEAYAEGSERAQKFEEYVHDRNHDILNRLAVVQTRMDLYHGPLRPPESEA